MKDSNGLEVESDALVKAVWPGALEFERTMKVRFSDTPDSLSYPKKVIIPNYSEDSIAILYEGVFAPSLSSREIDKTNPAK